MGQEESQATRSVRLQLLHFSALFTLRGQSPCLRRSSELGRWMASVIPSACYGQGGIGVVEYATN